MQISFYITQDQYLKNNFCMLRIRIFFKIVLTSVGLILVGFTNNNVRMGAREGARNAYLIWILKKLAAPQP
jgi:hypothetical protein